MAKTIKFDLPIDGVKVATLDDLRDHFTTETIGHFRSGLLARWLRSRSMAREQTAVEALTAGDDAAILKELCRIFDVEADDDAITAAVAEATGVPGIRPDQVPSKRARNPGDTFRDCPEGPELVVVPAGSFMMGSPDGEKLREDNEGPLHQVNISYPLAVGVYAVTFDEWDACVSDGGCSGYRPDDNGWGRGARPIIHVNWEDAQMYVKWLSWRTGKGYRLLSESEWEYVARAGTRTLFWWGDEGDDLTRLTIEKQVNEQGEFKQTLPVGSLPANAFGLYDVHFNVGEWVEDCWNESYEGAPEDGSAWVSEGCDCNRRVQRGVSCAGRVGAPSDDRADGIWSELNHIMDCIGFRVARTLAP